MKNPYYIYAPDYRESSSGVAVLHGLCDSLNKAGYETYLYGAKITNNQFNTPIIDKSLIKEHAKQGLKPIVVYPEVISKNPISKIIKNITTVRYILNKEGYLTGKQIKVKPNDLFFYYATFCMPDPSNQSLKLLRYPIVNTSLFKNEYRLRNNNYLYINRFPNQDIDFSLLPDDIIILDNNKPRSLAEIADIFKSAKTLYSYEWSITSIMAMLCGCPVIYLRGFGVDEHQLSLLFETSGGSAMIDEPNGLERAINTLHEVESTYKGLQDEFNEQLKVFINTTQEASNLKKQYFRNFLNKLKF